MEIIRYPHPTLRHVSKPLTRVDAALRKMVEEMFELMYEARGIGLAANQVDLPYRMFVLNLQSDPELKEEEHVFINPVVTHRKGTAQREEGCLSLPELFSEVTRPEKIKVNAFDLVGNELMLELDGLFARAFQHEVDHLDGVLFIDRLSETSVADIKESLEDFELDFKSRREQGEIADDATIAARLADLERLRT